MKKYVDKNGVEIESMDVLKLFHFVGARNKKHYTYKQAVLQNGELYISHLTSSGGFHPSALVSLETEVVQSSNWEKLR